MSIRRLSAKEVLHDIRSGLSTAALKKKYQLSSRGLRILFKQLREGGFLESSAEPQERTVVARDLLEDIRSGMGRSELMEKHKLSDRALQGLVSLLVDAGVIKREELYGELRVPDDTVFPESFRMSERYSLDFDALVYEVGNPDLHGKLLDVSEEGFRIIGIEAKANEMRQLVILGDPFGEITPFELQAKCRWSRQDRETGMCIAGFQITTISERDREELEKFIQLVRLVD